MAPKRRTPVVAMSVLPGQPTDGSGDNCIHLFVQDQRGPIVEPNIMYPTIGEDGKPTGRLGAKSARGRLACDPRRTVTPVTKNGVTHITMRTDVREAVTCLKCKKSKDYNNSNVSVATQSGPETTNKE